MKFNFTDKASYLAWAGGAEWPQKLPGIVNEISGTETPT